MAIIERLFIKMSVRERLLIWLSLLVLLSGLGVHFYAKYGDEAAWYQAKISSFDQQASFMEPSENSLKTKYNEEAVYQSTQKLLLAIVKIQRTYDQIGLIEVQLNRDYRHSDAFAVPVVEHQLILSLAGDRIQLSELLESFYEFYPASQIQSARFTTIDGSQLLVIDFIHKESIEEMS